MPDVINLGQFGDPHPSPMHGLADAFKTVADQKEQEKEFSMQMIKSKQEQKYHQNRLAVELAKMDHEQEETDYKHTQTTLKQLGMLKDQDPGKYALLMASPHGKEILKHVKSVDPDSVDDDATNPADKLIVPGIKEQASQKLDQIKLDYANAVRSGKPVDPYLKQSFDAINQHGVDDLSSAISEAAKNPTSADPEQFRKLVQNQLQMRKEFKAQQQQQQGGQGGTPTAGQGNPTADALNQQDPLGIMSNAK